MDSSVIVVKKSKNYFIPLTGINQHKQKQRSISW